MPGADPGITFTPGRDPSMAPPDPALEPQPPAPQVIQTPFGPLPVGPSQPAPRGPEPAVQPGPFPTDPGAHRGEF